mgnify:CR=1 FL=1|jgi:hypothetical protein|tara:strand:+ start:958 stop:1563 length:606 start_codon:yes stop_codon:yes gene_type:complete
MSNIPYNYQKYIDDVTKMRQRGAISTGEQIASPSSAGSRGLAKTTDFTNSPNQMMKGNMTESIDDIRNTINKLENIVKVEEYEPFPEGNEMTFEDDDKFFEAFGYIGYPEEELWEAEYQGRKVPLNKPMRGDVKKFKVYVKDPKTGNVKKVNFGHGGSSAKRKTMRIRKSNPKARKSFRARHNCANPGPKTKARYWSCRKW